MTASKSTKTSAMASPPRTRLRARKQNLPNGTPAGTGNKAQAQAPSTAAGVSPPSEDIQTLPSRITHAITNLSRQDHRLLLRKQAILQKYTLDIPQDFRKHAEAVQATLVFAQEEAGTAVCISDNGLLLTCSHCVAQSDEMPDPAYLHWLIFASGRAVTARCVAWDERRDLALLRIVAAQADSRPPSSFPSVQIAQVGPSLGAELICIGHPGSEDLEASKPGVKTHYDVLHLSTGAFRGYAEGQDLQDNAEIGALQHDCWTYWGHSGAPLLDQRTGKLVGLHSSWDEDTAMRRGVALVAIAMFVAENTSKHEHLDAAPDSSL